MTEPNVRPSLAAFTLAWPQRSELHLNERIHVLGGLAADV